MKKVLEPNKKEKQVKEFKKTISQLFLGTGAEFLGITLTPYSPNNILTGVLIVTSISGALLGGISVYSLVEQYEKSLEENEILIQEQQKQKLKNRK